MSEDSTGKELIPGVEELGEYASGDLLDVLLAAGIAKHLPKAALAKILKCPSDKLEAVKAFYTKELAGLKTHVKVIEEVMSDMMRVRAFNLYIKATNILQARLDDPDELKTAEVTAIQDSSAKLLKGLGSLSRPKGDSMDEEERKARERELESD